MDGCGTKCLGGGFETKRIPWPSFFGRAGRGCLAEAEWRAADNGWSLMFGRLGGVVRVGFQNGVYLVGSVTYEIATVLFLLLKRKTAEMWKFDV